MGEDKRRILFVDDEPNILSGLKRMLHSFRSEWDMSFANNASEALDLMAVKPFDVVVTDMRMPGMNGAELLGEVMERYPDTVRIVLSGQSDRNTMLEAVKQAHTFLSKPTDADAVRESVARAITLRDMLTDKHLAGLVSQADSLPPIPDLYVKIVEELQSEDPSIERVGKIVEQDPSMSAKMLQLVNSAYFGLPRQVNSAARAAVLLGVESIKSLVLMVHTFESFDQRKLPRSFSIETLWNHSIQVASHSQAIARAASTDPAVAEEAYTAGLLHDCGKLILASVLPDDYAETQTEANGDPTALAASEERRFGTSHAEVGAYLLGLWGLPDTIVEAVGMHHHPQRYPGNRFSPLTAVHVANALSYLNGSAPAIGTGAMDAQYLERLQMADRIEEWKERCAATP